MTRNEDELLSLLYSDLNTLSRSAQSSTATDTENVPSTQDRIRRFLRWFLTSKYGHYFVFVLVGLDVVGIFADFLITLHICEHSGDDLPVWRDIGKALGILSLVFSCLFMTELLCSVYAFGLQYFTSKFHIFDALSILASFFVDVFTRGTLEEAGSLIIVLRLSRVFKIVEESSTVAEETFEELRHKVLELQKENSVLRQRTTTGYTHSIREA